jgi:hypothetical protein
MGGDFLKLLREKRDKYHKELQEHGEKAQGIGPGLVEQVGSGGTTVGGVGPDILSPEGQGQESKALEVPKRVRRKPAVKRRKK